MKNRGLGNRFNQDELKIVWSHWHWCLWCGRAGADSFHHIISPSSPRFKEGEFNQSILNACPIHNFSCHLYNSELHKEKSERYLLQKVISFLLANHYVFKDIDVQFFKAYQELYEAKGKDKKKR